ncbi:DNA polymerase III subunit gamma/tau C-terminal domain-containing protein, partial [Oleiphilus sp. HI0061]
TETGVSAMLGTVDQKKIYRILDCLISRNAAAMLDEIKALAEFSPNYASVLATIAEVLHRVAIEQAVPGACDNSMGDQEHVVSYARKLCAEDVQLFYQVALVSRQDLAITPDPKSGLEMALLRMLAFQLSPSDQLGIDIVTAPVGNEVPVAEEQTVQSAPLENNLSEDESKKKTLLNSEGLNVEGVAQVERAPVETSESTASRLQEPVETQSFAETEQPVTSVVESPVQEPVSEPVPEPDKQSTLRNEEKSPIAESSSQDHVEKSELAADVLSSGWNKQVTQLGLSGMTLNLMLNSVLEENPDGLNLYFEAGHFRLLNPSHEGRIRESLSKEVAQGRNITFFEGLKPEHESPMMWRERVKAEMGEQAKLSVENDPYVQQMIREFDG